MKKTILVLGILFLFSISVSAVSLTGKGPKAGLNLCKLSGDDMVFSNNGNQLTYEWNFSAGYSAGLFLTFNITDKIIFQPELLYSYKTVKIKDIDSKLKMKYIEVPFLFKYNFQPEGKIQPALFLGPYAALKNKARLLVDSASYAYLLDEDVKGDYEVDIKNIKRMDFGFIFGAGFDYVRDIGVFSFDIRYSLGLTSITTDKKSGWNLVDEKDEGMDLKNSSILFMLGYAF
ncbi:MAG: PorT family protein [candidate division Zixibacteria bacterium]|nr:PorT family protein [candidate division Zixibacteria bacterium]